MSSIVKIVYFLAVFWLINGNAKVHYTDIYDNKSALQVKGIASILIIIGHCVNSIATCNLAYINVGSLCVAIFYFWSGYGVAFGCNTKNGYMENFWHKRLPKVIIPFALAHLIYIPVKLYFGIRFDMMDIVWSFLGQREIVDYSWYSISIILFYFLFWCSVKITSSNRARVTLIFFGTVLLSTVEACIFKLSQDWWFISNLAFVFGVCFAFSDVLRMRIWKVLIISMTMCFFSVAIIPGFRLILGEYTHSVYVLSSNLMSGAAALCAIIIFGMRRSKNFILDFLGRISYELYLLHGLFILIFSKIGIENILLIPATIIATIPAACLFNCFNRVVLRKLDNK